MSEFSTFLHMKHFYMLLCRGFPFCLLALLCSTIIIEYLLCAYTVRQVLNMMRKTEKVLALMELMILWGDRYYQLMILAIVLLEKWVSKRKGIYFKEGEEPENLIKNGWWEWGVNLIWGLKDKQHIIIWEDGRMEKGVKSHSWKDDFQNSLLSTKWMKTELLPAKRCLSLSD